MDECVPCCVHVRVCTLRPYHVTQLPQLELCQPGGLGEEGLQKCIPADRPRVYTCACAPALGSEKQMIDGGPGRSHSLPAQP